MSPSKSNFSDSRILSEKINNKYIRFVSLVPFLFRTTSLDRERPRNIDDLIEFHFFQHLLSSFVYFFHIILILVNIENISK